MTSRPTCSTRSVAHFGAEEAAVRYFGGKDVGVPDVQRLVTDVVAG